RACRLWAFLWTFLCAGDAGEQIAAGRPGLRGSRVLLDREAKALELRPDEPRHLGFAAARALDLAERDERVREAGPLRRANRARVRHLAGVGGVRALEPAGAHGVFPGLVPGFARALLTGP